MQMTDAEFNKFVLMLENEAFRFSRSQNEFKEHRVVIEQSFKIGGMFILRELEKYFKRMILYENQCFELLKALCYSVPQNPNVGRFEIANVILDTLQKIKDAD